MNYQIMQTSANDNIRTACPCPCYHIICLIAALDKVLRLPEVLLYYCRLRRQQFWTAEPQNSDNTSTKCGQYTTSTTLRHIADLFKDSIHLSSLLFTSGCSPQALRA